MQTKKEIRNLTRTLEKFAMLNRDMKLELAIMFLQIAAREGNVTQVELANLTGYPTSNVSRMLSLLHEDYTYKKNAKGLGLIKQHRNPMNSREMTISLSPKGKKFLEELGA